MRETVTELSPDWGELLDVYVLPSGHWAGLFRMDGQLFARTADDCVLFNPYVQGPKIRCLAPRKVVRSFTAPTRSRCLMTGCSSSINVAGRMPSWPGCLERNRLSWDITLAHCEVCRAVDSFPLVRAVSPS
jgi:hypothetical protein